jgi:hypothetical protein
MSTDCDKAIVQNFLTCSLRKDNVPGILPHYALTVFEDTQSTLPNPIEPSCPHYLCCFPPTLSNDSTDLSGVPNPSTYGVIQ